MLVCDNLLKPVNKLSKSFAMLNIISIFAS